MFDWQLLKTLGTKFKKPSSAAQVIVAEVIARIASIEILTNEWPVSKSFKPGELD